MRFYVVKSQQGEQLVEANTPQQAIARAAAEVMQAWPAKPVDVVRVMEAGGRILKATGGNVDG